MRSSRPTSAVAPPGKAVPACVGWDAPRLVRLGTIADVAGPTNTPRQSANNS